VEIAIMEAAKRVLKTVRDKYPGYDVYQICEAEGIIIHRAEMQEDCEGFYLPLEEGRVILVKAGLPSQVEREIIAHELYHHFAGVQKDFEGMERRRFLDMLPYLRDENQANDFAALFLCPDIRDCHSVHEVMGKYDCSKESAKRRRKIEEQSNSKEGLGNGFSEKER
jgi:Zn-dependent peptidase ImmA (M78 family)